jgi:hypothetical protein
MEKGSKPPRPKELSFTYAGVGFARLLIGLGIVSLLVAIFGEPDDPFFWLFCLAGALSSFVSAVALGVLCEISLSVSKGVSKPTDEI